MKKLMVPLAVIALMALAVPAAFAEWELGIGISPAQNQISTTPGAVDGILNFHVGYSWSILYASWDAFAMPSYWVYNATTYIDPVNGWYYPGIDVPGFLNLFDVGIKIVIKPVIAYAEIGTNLLYLYGGQIYKDPSGALGVGVNGRLGAGVKFGFWGVNISGTQVFATWNDLKSALDQAFHHGNTRDLTDGSVLSLNFSLYF
jgi:hypothetical protein